MTVTGRVVVCSSSSSSRIILWPKRVKTVCSSQDVCTEGGYKDNGAESN